MVRLLAHESHRKKCRGSLRKNNFTQNDGNPAPSRFRIIGGMDVAPMTKETKMKTTLLVAAIAAGITLAAGAQAREANGDRGARKQMPTFEQLDANSDGAVTPDEIATAMQAQSAARFADADTDGDGALSAEEMKTQIRADRQERMADRIAKLIERADTNGDGLLQADELAEQRGDRRGPSSDRMFDRFDTDEDGSLSAEEFKAAQERMQARRDRGDRGRRNN